VFLCGFYQKQFPFSVHDDKLCAIAVQSFFEVLKKFNERTIL